MDFHTRFAIGELLWFENNEGKPVSARVRGIEIVVKEGEIKHPIIKYKLRDGSYLIEDDSLFRTKEECLDNMCK